MDTSGSFTSGGMSEPRAFLDGCEKFVPTGIRSLDSPNLSQLMYLLRYHDPPISMAQQPLGCPGTTATTVPRHNSPYGAQAQQPLRCPGTTATTVPRHNSHYGAQTQQPLRCPDTTAPTVPKPPFYRGLIITFRHTQSAGLL